MLSIRNSIGALIMVAMVLFSSGCISAPEPEQPVNGTGTINTTPPAAPMPVAPLDTPTLIEQLKKVVVHINYTGESDPDIWGDEEFEFIGSGLIYSVDGGNAYVLTNRHVVDYNFQDYYLALKSERIEVRTSDGERFTASRRLIAPDNLDLAILVLENPPDNLSTATISDELPVVGEDVLIIGMPEQLEWSVSKGIVSGLRDFDIEGTAGGNEYTAVQTDAAINPGNSGGGMFTMDGRLVGINTWKYIGFDVEGLNFAISSIDFITHKEGFREKPLLAAGSPHTPGAPAAIGLAALYYDYYDAGSPLEASFSLMDDYGYETVSRGSLTVAIEDEKGNQLYTKTVEVSEQDFKENTDLAFEPVKAYTLQIPRSEISGSEDSYGYMILTFTTDTENLTKEVFVYIPSLSAEESYPYEDDYYYDDYYYDYDPYYDPYYSDDYDYGADYKPIGKSAVLDDITVTAVEGAFYEGFYYGEYEYDLVLEFENTGSQKKEIEIKDAVLVIDKKQYSADLYYTGEVGEVYPGAALDTELYFYVEEAAPEDATLYLEFRVIEGNQLETYETSIPFTP